MWVLFALCGLAFGWLYINPCPENTLLAFVPLTQMREALFAEVCSVRASAIASGQTLVLLIAGAAVKY